MSFIILLFVFAFGGIVGILIASHVWVKKIKKEKNAHDRNTRLLQLDDRWLDIRQRGGSLTDWFDERGVKTIAIYGFSTVGQRLYQELRWGRVAVDYVIDRSVMNAFDGIPVFRPEDELKPVDVIVVTAIMSFADISIMLEEKMECQIVSMENLVLECQMELEEKSGKSICCHTGLQ